MLFNSLSFALFLPVVFYLYWFVTKNNLRRQNLLLLVASYFFYACWDYRFLFLLIFSTLLDYYTGLKMGEAETKGQKKKWFWISVCVNLGFLAVFKYYNFFISSFADSLSMLGITTNFWTLQVILPVGISFYTFHGLSYVIDIYNNKIKPEKNFIDYAVFVSFFPLLVAGPIERATHLLPQIKKPRTFEYSKAVDGLRQILWGLFKKVVIADNCAVYADNIFNHASDFSGSTHIVGALFFAIQIYCDFSGYSDIALGTARLFGIELLRNFAFPYFSRDIAEFWRRWHISLSSWFRDYLYIPLGGSKGGTAMKVRNTFIIFLVSGFWHGANWTFIAWGALNAIYFLPLLLMKKNRDNLETVAQGKKFPNLRELTGMIITFSLTCFAWIFFRAQDMHHAFAYIGEIFSSSLFTIPNIVNTGVGLGLKGMAFFLTIFLLFEWFNREHKFALASLGVLHRYRYAVFYFLVLSIIYSSGFNQSKTFIYFQF